MNNKHLSWYKEINNNFIIASRAYFLHLYLSPEDMQEAKKSMREKGIKAEDVKNLPPTEEIHGLNRPPLPKVV